MNTKYFIIFLLLIWLNINIISNNNSNSYNTYNNELANYFKFSKEKGHLKCSFVHGQTMDNGPTSFAFDKEGILYVADFWNKGILIFDQGFIYRSRIDKIEFTGAFKLFIDDSYNITSYSHKCIYHMNKNNNTI